MKTALYRKYRPADFNGVIGQDVIVATLKNQIRLKDYPKNKKNGWKS